MQSFQHKNVLLPKSHAGQTVQFNASILAVPQIDSWKFQTLETDWQTVQSALGGTKDSFYSAVAIGSPEATAYADRFQSVVDTYEAGERQINDKDEKALKENSATFLALLKQNVSLEGALESFSTASLKRSQLFTAFPTRRPLALLHFSGS